MPINVSDAQSEYESRAAASSSKLVRKYTARTDKLSRAASPDAQKAYEEAMRDPKVLERRSRNLKKLSEADLNSAMEATGGANYSNAVSAKGGKWAKNFSPYAPTIDEQVSKMPAKSRDVATNINNRLLPLAKALRAKKEQMG